MKKSSYFKAFKLQNRAEVLQAWLTCDMKKDWHWYLGFSVDLALVLAQIPQLGVADLQGPGVGLRAVQAAEPVVPCSEVGQGAASLVTGEQWCTCEGDDAAGEHVQRGLLYPGHLHNDPH